MIISKTGNPNLYSAEESFVLDNDIIKKSECLFTPKNLVALGLYDSFYSLYKQLCGIAKIYIDSPPFREDDDHWRKYGSFDELTLYREHINVFLLQYSSYFHECPLCVSDDFLKARCGFMSMFAEDLNALNLYHEERIINFSKFQKHFQKFILRLIMQERRKCDDSISIFNVHSDLGLRFNKIIADIKYNNSLLNIEHIQYDLAVGAKPIFIYGNFHNLTCNQCEPKHNIVPKILSVKQLNGEQRCDLHVNYCEDCQEYFIGKHSLSIAQKEYGIILAKTHPCSPKQCSDTVWDNFNEESELHSYGYHVGESGLSIIDRRNLLSAIIDSGAMNKFSIERDISEAIKRFKYDHSKIQAVQDWNDDLQFIINYGNDEYAGEGYLK